MLRLDPAGRPRADQVAEALARVGDPNWASSAGIANPADDPTVVAVPDPAGDPTVVAVPADLAATRVSTPAAVVPSPEPAPVSSSPVPWADDEEPAARKSGGGLGWLISAAVLLAVLVGMVLVITRSSGSHHTPSSPTYPTVTGRLGSDLSTLQKDVQP
jgi:hypothetical protein